MALASGVWLSLAVFTLSILFHADVTGSVIPSLSKMKVNNSKPRQPFVDESGRVRTFHGLNRVKKGFPWYPSELLNSSHLDALQGWGFNVVRLGMMWSGVEVAPFSVNKTYLSIMDGIISSLADRGIYVILDMHQDALSSKFGLYDGAPLWLIDSFPPPEHEYPYPFSKPPSSWSLNYVTSACGDAFTALYTNQSAAVAHLSFFWRTVAERFGRFKNVLGYEIINEPFPGNVLSDPLLFIPGLAGSKYLLPLYDAVASEINRVDSQSMVFYEPVTWGMILHGDKLGTGFSRVPGGDQFKERAVLSFHYYCWFAGTYDDNPFPKWLRTLCDRLFFPDVLRTVAADIKDTGGSYFLTEFGECQGAAPHNSTQYQECLSVLSTADPAFLSWTYWDSQFFGPGGAPIHANAKLFSRPYAQAVSGTPIVQTFNDRVPVYELQYLGDPNISAATVIYVSKLHYPSGFRVKVTAGAEYNVTDSQYVQVYHPDDTATVVGVLITSP